MSDYLEMCVDTIKQGVLSYIDVTKRLKVSRGYGSEANLSDFEERAPRKYLIPKWVPLLWGTF